MRGTQARLIWVTFSESCRLQRVTGAGVVIPCAGADRSEISAQGLAIADQCGTTQSGEAPVVNGRLLSRVVKRTEGRTQCPTRN